MNHHVLDKQAPIGGTSAGMAIAGGVYFSAENGTITSGSALNNPFHPNMTLGYEDFLHIPYLQNVVTDTHYDDPDRRGRHATFLARMATDQGIVSRGIACDEYTAVCIDENGNARCYGEYPAYDEDIYFLQANCINPVTPETCEAGNPLTWNYSEDAVIVYRVKGTLTGINSFELSNWLNGSGGNWEHWWVNNGQLQTSVGVAPDCIDGIPETELYQVSYFYDSRNNLLHINADSPGRLTLFDINGKVLISQIYTKPVKLSPWINQLLILRFESKQFVTSGKVMVY